MARSEFKPWTTWLQSIGLFLAATLQSMASHSTEPLKCLERHAGFRGTGTAAGSSRGGPASKAHTLGSGGTGSAMGVFIRRIGINPFARQHPSRDQWQLPKEPEEATWIAPTLGPCLQTPLSLSPDGSCWSTASIPLPPAIQHPPSLLKPPSHHFPLPTAPAKCNCSPVPKTPASLPPGFGSCCPLP